MPDAAARATITTVTPYLEIGGDWREVAPGTWLVELPLPFSLGLVNVYLLKLKQGWMLVDCGMDTDACLHALDRARAGLGIAWTDIRYILLTHFHPDHGGLARRLLRLTGARLLLHHADRAMLDEISDEARYTASQTAILVRAGVAPEMIGAIGAAMTEVRKSFHRLSPEAPLAGGELIEAEAGPLEVIWTPGHSPGHVCLYDRRRRLLLSGDHMLEHISPNIGWQPGEDALADFLASLERIAQLEIDLVLPSHGAPFKDHHEWIRATRDHHRVRCARILQLAREAPLSAADLVERIWEGLSSPFHYRFAVFEVLAHVEYLERRRSLVPWNGNAIVRWQTTSMDFTP